MFDIGKILRERRESLNKSYEAIHSETKIAVEHLKLLEENNFSFLPEFYIRGFLKAYAQALGLDARALLDRYKELREEESLMRETRDSAAESAEATGGASRKLEFSLGAGVILLLVGLVFVYLKYRSAPSEVTPVAGESTLPESTIEQEVFNDGRPHPETGEQEAPPLALKVTAIQKTWVQVTIDDQKTNEYTLLPGDRLEWTARASYKLVIGNAGGVVLRFGGKEFSNLGPPGTPVRLFFTKEGMVEKRDF